jgi:hypothetical protein
VTQMQDGLCPWQVGVARRCITPAKPTWLYGYTGPARHKPSTGVLNDLTVTALALDDGNQPAIVLAFDLCAFRRPLAQSITKRVVQATGIPEDRILLNLSHTHSGPILDQRDGDNRFPMDDAQREWIAEYTVWMEEQAEAAAREAMASRFSASLSQATGVTDILCNRRVVGDDGVWQKMAPNPDGPIDPTVQVLRVDDESGAPRVILFGCACHNVTLNPNNLLISPDYAGFAREAIEKAFPDCHAMFLMGCGADANSTPRGGDEQVAWTQKHGERLAQEVCRVTNGGLSPLRPPLQCLRETVPLPLQTFPSRETLDALAADEKWWRALTPKKMVATLDEGGTLPTSHPAPVSVWRFGPDWTLIGLSGEVVCAYALRIVEGLASDPCWVAAYSHDVFGYLPSARIIAEGGYETLGLLPPAMGLFAPEAEDVLVKTVVDLAGQIERS